MTLGWLSVSLGDERLANQHITDSGSLHRSARVADGLWHERWQTAATRHHLSVLRVGERVDEPVAKVLLCASGLRLRQLCVFDPLKLALGVLHGKIAGHARAQVTQAGEERRQAGLAVRPGGDGFP